MIDTDRYGLRFNRRTVGKPVTEALGQRPAAFDSFRWFNPEMVVHSFTKSLFAAQIPFRRLHGHVPEQELNLFQFTAGGMTEPST
jgi:hypothetical protein